MRFGAFPLLGDTQTVAVSTAESKVENNLLPSLLDRLREAAYRTCRDDNTQEYLANLLYRRRLASAGERRWLAAGMQALGLGR